MIINKNENYKVVVYFVDDKMNLDFLNEEEKSYVLEREFKATPKEHICILGPSTSNTILIGIGEKEKVDRRSLIIAGTVAYKVLNSNKIKEATIHTYNGICRGKSARNIIEGLLQQEYSFDTYKSEKEKKYLESVGIAAPDMEIEKLIEEIQNYMYGVNLTRELVNTPSIDMYPEILAKKAAEELEAIGVKVEVYGKKEIEDMGMTAFLAVAEGSDKEPKLIVMKYLPEGEDKEAITLVGKGLTYDSGGYAIKPATGMVTMKSDMGGSASVIGAMYSIAKNKLPKNVVGVVAACENMIDGSAYKNGDIVKTMKGTTIEIINTDAEGRVTLADSIYYAATKINSSCIIDLATLTGACVVGLGDYTTGAVTNSDELFDKLSSASDRASEYLSKLPVVPELREQVKGEYADITNSTGKPGGAITAGIFLENFVEAKPWVHLDIAGPSFAKSAWGYLPKGATGIMVKTLYNFIKEESGLEINPHKQNN